MKITLITFTLLVTACAADPTMFGATFDAGDGELEGLDTDTAELEGLDTDTAELEGLDTDTAELEGLDTDTAELEDTGPTWVCDLNGEGCENWQRCILETISICPLSPDPIPISALNYGIDWLICKEGRCPTTLYHRECRDVNAIGTRCLP